MDFTTFIRGFLYAVYSGNTLYLSNYLMNIGMSRETFDELVLDSDGFFNDQLQEFAFTSDYAVYLNKIGFSDAYMEEVFRNAEDEDTSVEEALSDTLSGAQEVLFTYRDPFFLSTNFSLCTSNFFKGVLKVLKESSSSTFAEDISPLSGWAPTFYKPLSSASQYELAMKSMLLIISYIPSGKYFESYFAYKDNPSWGSLINIHNLFTRDTISVLAFFARYSDIDHSDFSKVSASGIKRFEDSANINLYGAINSTLPIDFFELLSSLLTNPFIRGYLKSFSYFENELVSKFGANPLFSTSLLSKINHLVISSDKVGVTSAKDWVDVEQFFL